MEIYVKGCKIELTPQQIKKIEDYGNELAKKERSWTALLKFLEFSKVKDYAMYENKELGLVADLLDNGVGIKYVILYGVTGYLHGFAFWETKDLSKYIKELKSK